MRLIVTMGTRNLPSARGARVAALDGDLRAGIRTARVSMPGW
jgi:hypothetical protein